MKGFFQKVGWKVDYGIDKKAALFWQKAGRGICSLMEHATGRKKTASRN